MSGKNIELFIKERTIATGSSLCTSAMVPTEKWGWDGQTRGRERNMWEGMRYRKEEWKNRVEGIIQTWRWGRKKRGIGWTNRRDERAESDNGGKEINKRIKILFYSSLLMSHALVITEIKDGNSTRHHEILRSHGYRAQGICSGLSLTHLHMIWTQESLYTCTSIALLSSLKLSLVFLSCYR
jgi:hypothetical protein